MACAGISELYGLEFRRKDFHGKAEAHAALLGLRQQEGLLQISAEARHVCA